MYGAILGYRALRSAQPPSAVTGPCGVLVCLMVMFLMIMLMGDSV
ncbi:MAG: hypothetical protein V7603_1145 [Micromonosporaceae bacterium]